MIHYSCDRCQRPLSPREPRYVVTIQVERALEPLPAEELDDDRDHLAEIHETLETAYQDPTDWDQEDTLRQTYDLCQECYARFLRDPLAAEASLQLGFSPN